VGELSKACETSGLPVKRAYTIAEIIKLTGLSDSWVYKVARGGIKGAEKIEGIWYFPAEQVERWLEDIATTAERKRIRYLDPDEFCRSRRPSHIAVTMISSKIRDDPRLTGAEQVTFLAALQRYVDEWDTAYERRKEGK
jgi:predicted DNA-binding transcriptional regulator AlpA